MKRLMVSCHFVAVEQRDARLWLHESAAVTHPGTLITVRSGAPGVECCVVRAMRSYGNVPRVSASAACFRTIRITD